MPTMVVRISDPELALRLGAKEIDSSRRGIAAAKDNAILFDAGEAAYRWPIRQAILLEMAISEKMKAAARARKKAK